MLRLTYVILVKVSCISRIYRSCICIGAIFWMCQYKTFFMLMSMLYMYVFCWLVYVCCFCVYIRVLAEFCIKILHFVLNWQWKFLSWIFVYLVKTGFIDKRAIWDPVTVTSLSTGFLSQISSHRLVYDSYPLYLQIEILRISLIETESGKESKGKINVLWKSLEMFVMVTWEVRSGIWLPRPRKLLSDLQIVTVLYPATC